MQSREQFIESMIHRYERYVAPFTFVMGFVLDTITLKRIDIWFDHIILFGYLMLAGIGMIVVNAYEAGRLRFRPFDSIVPFMPVVVQFGFGGLFSAFVIFYTQSGVIAKSWLFLLILGVLLIGNERFRKHYQRLTFQLSIFFVVLFSYTIFALPLVTKQIGVGTFLLSGVVSIAALGLFLFLLGIAAPQYVRQSRKALVVSIGVIYVIFHLFYFFNIIPPIPLAVKESGIYHSVKKDSNGYHLSFEPAAWYAFFRKTSSVYHWQRGEPIYFFSSLFAPTKLNITIIHHWFYYDEARGVWVDRGSVSIPIVGGRDQGYRGYSYITSGKPGMWRVEVATVQGQVVGRETFTVEETFIDIGLKTEVK